ncbi:MAG: hypothetical protein J7559_06730 [Cohnella sp.]|nr:hypothetical protein [Cohnella sp.]
MFEEEYEALYRKQLTEARGQRREMLERDLSATKKMLEVAYPVIGSLASVVLEYEMVSLSGVRIFGDAFIPGIATVLEEENFITRAENITRKRFSFERARIRSVTALGYAFFPYSKDELDQQPEACRRDLRELIFSRTSGTGEEYLALCANEREALRFAALSPKPFNLSALSAWLRLHREASGKVAKMLAAKGYLRKIGGGRRRSHEFAISEQGRSLLFGQTAAYIGRAK